MFPLGYKNCRTHLSFLGSMGDELEVDGIRKSSVVFPQLFLGTSVSCGQKRFHGVATTEGMRSWKFNSSDNFGSQSPL